MENYNILRILIYGGMGLVFVIGVIWLFINEKTCSECKERRAYEKTGSRRRSEFKNNLVEFELKCKFCGHSKWLNNWGGFSGGE